MRWLLGWSYNLKRQNREPLGSHEAFGICPLPLARLLTRSVTCISGEMLFFLFKFARFPCLPVPSQKQQPWDSNSRSPIFQGTLSLPLASSLEPLPGGVAETRDPAYAPRGAGGAGLALLGLRLAVERDGARGLAARRPPADVAGPGPAGLHGGCGNATESVRARVDIMPLELELCPGRWVGGQHPCFIIAEIGQNHQGDLDVAKRMIRTAKVRGGAREGPRRVNGGVGEG